MDLSKKLDLIQKIAEGDVPSRTSPRKAKPATPAVAPSPAPKAGVVPTKGKNDVPTRGDVPARGTPGVPATPVVGTPRSSSIRNMQKAIQAFANQAVAYKKDPRNPNKVSAEDGRKDFNDFLAEQYSAGAVIHGEEWSPSEKATKKEQKQPTEIIELDNVINNLRRIGPGSKEAMPDGVWDFRTNNAVKNVYAFAEALIKSAQDFGSNLKGFNRFDLVKLAKSLPRGDLSKYKQKDLEPMADTVTPLIEKLTEYYKEYSKYILNHPKYAQYINKNTPLFKVQQPGVDPAAIPEDIKQYENNLNDLVIKNVPVPNAQGKIVSFQNFPLSYLKDMNSVYSLMMSKELGFTREDIGNPEKVSGVLNEISSYINALKVAPPQQG